MHGRERQVGVGGKGRARDDDVRGKEEKKGKRGEEVVK